MKVNIVTADSVAGAVPLLKDCRKVYLIYDKNVEPFALELTEALDGQLVSSASIETSEKGKAIGSIVEICGWLLENGADRDSFLLAMGGGITTDMAGFAASIYMRGIRFGYIPTTVLAQVDAAIGGKTGVNMSDYKNMLGTIRQPLFTLECPQVLKTLNYREFVGGTAELLKTFIIDDTDGNYLRAVRMLSAINGAESRRNAIEEWQKEIGTLIMAAARIKAGIVERDEFEKGERRKLNLGHTFAHAIEKHAHETGVIDISHGEAVAVGMVMAARLSEKLGIAEEERLSAKLANNFAGCGLPVRPPFPLQDFAAAMEKDKKAAGGGLVRFVLIKRIGEVTIKELPVANVVELLSEE